MTTKIAVIFAIPGQPTERQLGAVLWMLKGIFPDAYDGVTHLQLGADDEQHQCADHLGECEVVGHG
jgi:hypothetical protein